MSNELNNLLLHPRSAAQLHLFIRNPAHAVLISGPGGSGKNTVATAAAATILDIQNLDNYPYFIQIQRLKNKQDISIEQVREVINSMKLKTPGRKKIQRAVLIKDAQFLSLPAQNSLLKILEEPSSDTIFLLTASSTQSVLPTIISRSQVLEIQPVGLEKAIKYWGDKYSDEQIRIAWQLSGGLAGLLSALLAEDQKHPLKEAVVQTRKYLASKTYGRLLIMDNLSRDKEQLSLFLEALARILSFLHKGAIKNDKPTQATKLLEDRKLLIAAQKALRANTNPKIVCLKLTMDLRV
jgi:DNA polymerase-3 subunit delta'